MSDNTMATVRRKNGKGDAIASFFAGMITRGEITKKHAMSMIDGDTKQRGRIEDRIDYYISLYNNNNTVKDDGSSDFGDISIKPECQRMIANHAISSIVINDTINTLR